jgi:hypothetical protein
MFHIGLKPCCEFCKIYENGLAWFESNLQIIWKKLGKPEKEKRKKKGK